MSRRSGSVPSLVFPTWLVGREACDGGSGGDVYERSPIGVLERKITHILFIRGCSLGQRRARQPLVILQERVLRESECCQELAKTCTCSVWIAMLLYSHYTFTATGNLTPEMYAREMLGDDVVYGKAFGDIVDCLNKNRATFAELFRVIHGAVERVVCKYSAAHSV